MSAPSSTVLDHLPAPRNAGVLELPDVVGYADLDGRGPRMTLFLEIRGDRVEKALFQTFGCGYAIACCSALTVLVMGQSLADCWNIRTNDLVVALGSLPEEKMFCATLAIAALRDALTKWQAKEDPQ